VPDFLLLILKLADAVILVWLGLRYADLTDQEREEAERAGL